MCSSRISRKGLSSLSAPTFPRRCSHLIPVNLPPIAPTKKSYTVCAILVPIRVTKQLSLRNRVYCNGLSGLSEVESITGQRRFACTNSRIQTVQISIFWTATTVLWFLDGGWSGTGDSVFYLATPSAETALIALKPRREIRANSCRAYRSLLCSGNGHQSFLLSLQESP